MLPWRVLHYLFLYYDYALKRELTVLQTEKMDGPERNKKVFVLKWTSSLMDFSISYTNILKPQECLETFQYLFISLLRTSTLEQHLSSRLIKLVFILKKELDLIHISR